MVLACAGEFLKSIQSVPGSVHFAVSDIAIVGIIRPRIQPLKITIEVAGVVAPE